MNFLARTFMANGEKWVSPFNIDLQPATKTVAYDIQRFKPMQTPEGKLYYIDYVYEDGTYSIGGEYVFEKSSDIQDLTMDDIYEI